MRLGVRPTVFLARLLVAFLLTYLLWTPIAPAYTRLLATLTRWFLHLTETSSDPNLHHVTAMWVRGTDIFYLHRLFPSVHPPGIPAEWVQANLVLLIPLMLATPARSYTERYARLALALGIALALQVVDLAVTVKSFYASQLGSYSRYYYSDLARHLYQFGDAFAQSMDTQLFPFAIWAGIHFKQLLGGQQRLPTPAPAPAAKRPIPHRRKRRAT
ncbi:MAG: hypothetical protein ACE5I7_02890 [Candidatus Binatia bacterium]